jgi:DNA-binding response OmpR family regulator
MTSSGKVVRREDLCLRLMDHGFAGSESTIKIHIHNLRLKLEDDLVQPKYIETVFGIGYRFLENES